ncbi:MAG TPA: glycosyltransferase [Pirellulales bacterium]|nr:glycosyltransferase [Pirellulales bacterium]
MHIAVACDHPDAVLVHKPSWVADGFRAAGHSVVPVYDLAGVRSADEECDLVLFDHKASGMNRAALAALTRRPRRAVWAQWWRDLIAMDASKRLPDQDYFRAFAAVMRGMDIVFVKERSLVDEYHQLGINARWLDQACPAEMPACEHRRQPEWDVLVLGSTGYVQRRADARALADAGFRVLWTGMAGSDPVPSGVQWQPWVHPLKLPELASRCGVVLGVDWRSDLPGYTSDRTYLACGMGACYIARCHDASSPPATLAAWVYSRSDELIAVVRAAMSDVDERRRRGERSRRLVMEQHTYAHRAAEIANLVAPTMNGFR